MKTTTERIKCNCGTVFRWDPEEEDDALRQVFKPSICKPCAARIAEERAAREAIEATQREEDLKKRIARNKVDIASKINNATPELFRTTDACHPKFNAAAWAKIGSHKLTERTPWLGLVGMAGRCKTRIAYLYAANELERLTNSSIPSFAFVASYEIGDAVARQYVGNFEEKAKTRDYLYKLRVVDVLLIDDLGKGSLTPAVASELFALLNHRYSHVLRTIWSSNSSPEVIAAGLPEDMAGSFAGRILESSKIFTFG
jgi:DNA replication protein DnaC